MTDTDFINIYNRADEYESVTSLDAFPVTERMMICLDLQNEASVFYCDRAHFVKLCKLSNIDDTLRKGIPSEYIEHIDKFKKEYPNIKRKEVTTRLWIAIIKSYNNEH